MFNVNPPKAQVLPLDQRGDESPYKMSSQSVVSPLHRPCTRVEAGIMEELAMRCSAKPPRSTGLPVLTSL
jgi:hypothetical protein